MFETEGNYNYATPDSYDGDRAIFGDDEYPIDFDHLGTAFITIGVQTYILRDEAGLNV